MMKKNEIIQVKNPKTGRYLRVNKTTGKIMYPSKKTPYANIPIIKKEGKNND